MRTRILGKAALRQSSPEVIWAFDIGTTSLKAVAFLPDGTAISRWAAAYPLSFLDGDRIEATPHSWELAFRRCARALVTDLQAFPPCAVVVGGQGPTLVPIDKKGQAMDRAISWMDRRASAESAEIRERTGLFVDGSFYMPKALWYSRHGKARDFVQGYTSCPDYLVTQLTGNLVSGLPAPGFEPLVWERSVMQSFGLGDAWPPFIPCGTVAGHVTAHGERWSGLPRGTAVVMGPPDFVESWLGTACVYPGRAVDRGGTSQGINLCTDKAVHDPRLLTLPHIVPGCWNLSGIISTSGKALEWVRSLVHWDRAPYPEVIRRAMEVPPGSEGLLFLPFLSGERAPLWRADARALFFGLQLQHGSAHLVRSVLEGVCYAIRHVLDCIRDNGLLIGQFRCTGRQATSTDWTRIKASISGVPCLIPREVEAEPLGGAILAAVAVGWYPDLTTAAESMVHIEEEILPEPSWIPLYEEGFQLYKTLVADALNHFPALTRYRQDSLALINPQKGDLQ